MPPGASRFQLPMLSRFTVPPLRRIVTSALPLAAFGMCHSLRWEWPPKSGSASTIRTFLLGPKRSWYHFAAEIPLAPDSDDHAVVLLAGVAGRARGCRGRPWSSAPGLGREGGGG